MRNRFSTEVKETISLSAQEALRTNSTTIGAAHLLLGLIRHGDNKALTILEKDLGLSLAGLASAIEETLPPGTPRRESSWRLPLDRGAERSIRGSISEAKKAGSATIGTEHLLTSLIGDRENQLYLIFRRWGIDHLPDPPTGH